MRTSPQLLLSFAALLAATFVFAAQPETPQTPPPAAPPAPASDKPAVPATTQATTNTSGAPAALPPDASKLADKPAAPEVAVKADDAAAKAAAAATKAKDAAGHETLSVDFPDEDIRNILRNVADLFELNIIMPETLQGKTTIKLRDVTWRQIFQNVLDPVGYTYVEDGNIIKIVTKESLNDEPMTTEVFLVNYAKASEIAPTIKAKLGGKGSVDIDTRSNSLVVTERPSHMSGVRQLIEQLDRATDQVMIETKFIEVTTDNAKNVGVNWSSLNGYTLSAGNLTSTYGQGTTQTTSNGNTANNGNTLTTNNGTTASTSNAQNGSTSNGSNTTSSVTSTNGTPTSTSTTGTNGALTNGTTLANTSGTSNSVSDALTNTASLINSVANSGNISHATTALFNASQFNLVLSALSTLSDVKIVSNPTIVTLNNTEATINVGESDPLPNYTFNAQTGTQEVSGFTYKDIGIILKVTPQVNARGFIKLVLSPEVSQKNGTLTFGAAQLPIIATRKASTTVSLKDGFTMGIGGLLSTQTTKGGTSVPVLGSIPLLGRLFRSDSLDKTVTNLIIFITAKTLSAEGAPIEQVFESQRVRDLQIHREELPGFRDGSDPFLPTPPPSSNSGEKAPDKKPFFHLPGSDE